MCALLARRPATLFLVRGARDRFVARAARLHTSLGSHSRERKLRPQVGSQHAREEPSAFRLGTVSKDADQWDGSDSFGPHRMKRIGGRPAASRSVDAAHSALFFSFDCDRRGTQKSSKIFFNFLLHPDIFSDNSSGL